MMNHPSRIYGRQILHISAHQDTLGRGIHTTQLRTLRSSSTYLGRGESHQPRGHVKGAIGDDRFIAAVGTRTECKMRCLLDSRLGRTSVEYLMEADTTLVRSLQWLWYSGRPLLQISLHSSRICNNPSDDLHACACYLLLPLIPTSSTS
jgi:hypothetical protein